MLTKKSWSGKKQQCETGFNLRWSNKTMHDGLVIIFITQALLESEFYQVIQNVIDKKYSMCYAKFNLQSNKQGRSMIFDAKKAFTKDSFGNDHFDPSNLSKYIKNCDISEFNDILDLFDKEYKDNDTSTNANSFIEGGMLGIAVDIWSRSSESKIQERCLKLWDRIIKNRENVNKKENLRRPIKRYDLEVLSGSLLKGIGKLSLQAENPFKNIYVNRIKEHCAELSSQPEELKRYRESFEKRGFAEFLPLSVPKKQQQTEKKTPPNLQYTKEDLLREGIDCPFSLSEEQKNSKFMFLEIRETTSAKWKISSKNSDIMEIHGYDASGHRTFNLALNKRTGKYIYQGGKPEKVCSDNPALKYSPMPEDQLSCLKYNYRLALTKAQTAANLKNGIEFKEASGKNIRAIQPEKGFAEITVNNAEGKPSVWFKIDTRTGEYRAENLVTGEKYSNREEDKGNCKGELPPDILKLMQSRAKKASNIAQNRAMNDIGYQKPGMQH